MKKIALVTLSFILVAISPLSLHAQKRPARYEKLKNYIFSLPKQDLSQTEKQILTEMYHEEKLAHDVYVTLYRKFQSPVFNNISRAETVHQTSIKYLLEKYNLPIPVTDTTVGKFADPKYTNLYNQLVQKGSTDLKNALIVGATIEDMDIHDLDQALTKVDNQDITIVFKRIRRGSYHHIRAFTRVLYSLYNYKYQPQYISQEEYQQIIQNCGPKHFRGKIK